MKFTYIVIADCGEGVVPELHDLPGVEAILSQVAEIPGVEYITTYVSDDRCDHFTGEYREIRVPTRQLGGRPGRTRQQTGAS